MKIKIKTEFWNQDKNQIIQKLVNIIFWLGFFAIINIGTAIYRNDITTTLINTLPLTLITIIYYSYNKREHKND